jgi:hypothetical protein
MYFNEPNHGTHHTGTMLDRSPDFVFRPWYRDGLAVNLTHDHETVAGSKSKQNY